MLYLMCVLVVLQSTQNRMKCRIPVQRHCLQCSGQRQLGWRPQSPSYSSPSELKSPQFVFCQAFSPVTICSWISSSVPSPVRDPTAFTAPFAIHPKNITWVSTLPFCSREAPSATSCACVANASSRAAWKDALPLFDFFLLRLDGDILSRRSVAILGLSQTLQHCKLVACFHAYHSIGIHRDCRIWRSMFSAWCRKPILISFLSILLLLIGLGSSQQPLHFSSYHPAVPDLQPPLPVLQE